MLIPRTHGQMCGSPWPQRIERYINLHDKNRPNVSVILYRETNGINQSLTFPATIVKFPERVEHPFRYDWID